MNDCYPHFPPCPCHLFKRSYLVIRLPLHPPSFYHSHYIFYGSHLLRIAFPFLSYGFDAIPIHDGGSLFMTRDFFFGSSRGARQDKRNLVASRREAGFYFLPHVHVFFRIYPFVFFNSLHFFLFYYEGHFSEHTERARIVEGGSLRVCYGTVHMFGAGPSISRKSWSGLVWCVCVRDSARLNCLYVWVGRLAWDQDCDCDCDCDWDGHVEGFVCFVQCAMCHVRCDG